MVCKIRFSLVEATMYRNRFSLKAVFDYAWKGSHEVEATNAQICYSYKTENNKFNTLQFRKAVIEIIKNGIDKTTGFLYVRRKSISNIGIPITEEKAKQKVQQLFMAFDAACAKHKELQKTGVKELFSSMRFINSVAEADDSITGIANIRMYYMPYLKVNEKDGEAVVLETTVSLNLGRNYQIIELQYWLLPVKEVIQSIAVSPVKSNHVPDMLYRRSANNLLAPYYAY